MNDLLAELTRIESSLTPGPWFHNGLQTDDLSDDYRLVNAIFNTDGGGDPIPHEKELKLLRRPEHGEPKEADAETSNTNIRAITALRNLLPALIAKLRDAGEREWQPIATAPKDGTRVLLACPGATGAVVGWWQTSKYAKNPRPYWTNDSEHIWGVATTRERQPTHWQPIPTPPTDREGEGR